MAVSRNPSQQSVVKAPAVSHKHDIKVDMRVVDNAIYCPSEATGFTDHWVEWRIVDDNGDQDQEWAFCIMFSPIIQGQMPFKNGVGGCAPAGGEVNLKVKPPGQCPLGLWYKYCVFAVNTLTGQVADPLDPKFSVEE